MFDIINRNKPNLIQKCYTPSGQATVNQVNVNIAQRGGINFQGSG